MTDTNEIPQDVDDVEGHARMHFSSGALGGQDKGELPSDRAGFSSGALGGQDDVEGHAIKAHAIDDEQQGDGEGPSSRRI